ncbi:DUF1007 family protein [Rhizobium paknamense]|uniref:ABC-type uncharacterized transport system substrate-binding protein n=1 Tax=Rhizobium paknamense TaxID=1206817 RepID=A0ABU0IDA8_9HYPH|nr:DUF1007 family protein [Rhizobium paknamense]MDQ0456227.1 ABC-type uncharacterized transport system substrate-binding protein [Rhizobium paknamense]
MKKHFSLLTLAAILALPSAPAHAHPHVFAEARLEVVAGANNTVTELRNVWRFDEVFSSSVLMDFDKNGDLKLDHSELQDIANTIRSSLADYGYFTFITASGATIKVNKPEVFNADFKDNKLLVFFIVKPEKPIPLKGNLSFGVHDPTLYTSIDFKSDSDLVEVGNGWQKCKRTVIRPNPDEVIKQNQGMLTEAFFNDPTGTDYGKLFAVRLDLACGN